MRTSHPPYFVFVGLGNPGTRYEWTRHNIGFQVVQAFARREGLHFKEDKRFSAYVAKGVVEGTLVHLLKPATFMNLSGSAIRRYLDFYKLEASRLVVIVDDVALSFGQLRFKLQGSAGGHNGLKSVESHLGTSHYMRLRMGVGHPGEKVLADYVLEPFNKEELEQLEAFVDCGVDAMQRLLKESVTQVMNAINTKAQK